MVENRLQGYLYKLVLATTLSWNAAPQQEQWQRQDRPHPNGRLQSCGALQHPKTWNGRSELLYFLTGNPRGNRGVCSRSTCPVRCLCLGLKHEHELQICCLAHRLWVCNNWDALALRMHALRCSLHACSDYLPWMCLSQAPSHTTDPKIHSKSPSGFQQATWHPDVLQMQCSVSANRDITMLMERMDLWNSPWLHQKNSNLGGSGCSSKSLVTLIQCPENIWASPNCRSHVELSWKSQLFLRLCSLPLNWDNSFDCLFGNDCLLHWRHRMSQPADL